MDTAPYLDIFWILVSGSLVFIMQAGFTCLESGLTRSKNSINVAIKNLADFCFSVCGFWIVGYGLMFGTSVLGLFGTDEFFISLDRSPFTAAFFFFQAMFCGTATTIFSGAVAERMRFSSYLLVAGFLATAVYPIFGHWAWGGLPGAELTGWLGRMGFVDFAGSTVVHSVGGWVALASLLVIGPREGRFPESGPPREITPHSLPLSVLGAMLLWFGWFGFNGGSTLAMNDAVPGIIAKTTLAAGAGAVACLFLVWRIEGIPRVTALINGCLGGLVAITANCHCVGSAQAVIIGAVAGPVVYGSEHLLLRMKIDDAVGAVPVHLACGIWGTLAVALFGDPEILGTGLTFFGQLAVQATGIGAAFAASFLLPLLIMGGLDRTRPMRVSGKDERVGLNVSEHGARTELTDFFEVMDRQAETGDLSLRVPEEPFTEVGLIARRYNQVMRSLQEASSKIEAVFKSTGDAIVSFATDTYTILHANPGAGRMFGFSSPGGMIGMPVTELFSSPEENGRKSIVRDLLSHRLVELTGIRRGGAPFPVEGVVTVAGVSFDTFYVGAFRDVSERKATESALARQQAFFRELFESSPLAIVHIEPSGRVVDVNPGFTGLFGYEPEEIRGRLNRGALVPEHLMEESRAFTQAVMGGKTVFRETVRKHKDGRLIQVSVVGYPIRVESGIAGVYYLYTDITRQKEYEAQLSHQAFHDALTGLPNRVLFFERLSRAVHRRSRKESYRFAAMMLDMDRFKSINDTLGHQAGDEFLVTTATRINTCIRSMDTAARLGGDEFGIIMEEFRHPREVIEVARRIMQKVQEPIILAGTEVRSSASVGIVLNTERYTDAESIMRDADIAMYRAKEVGRARYKVFNHKMHDHVLRASELERNLHRALENDELAVYYQPIVSVDNRRLTGFEALVRWIDPEKGIVSPGEFIPLAEETGQIVAIGRYVLKEACSRMMKWRHLIPEAECVTVSVNVSAKQFLQPDLVGFVLGTLKETGLPPKCLKLELTESTLMKDARGVLTTMNQLKEEGVRIVIDDFGTGYSSLSYIQHFPIDGLKIDRSFISGGERGENSKIVETIIALARSLKIGVVAEGVEEMHQLDMLRQAQCECAQGFMFAKPLTPEDAEAFIALPPPGQKEECPLPTDNPEPEAD